MRLSPALAGLLMALFWTSQSTAAAHVDIRAWEVPWNESGPHNLVVAGDPAGKLDAIQDDVKSINVDGTDHSYVQHSKPRKKRARTHPGLN